METEQAPISTEPVATAPVTIDPVTTEPAFPLLRRGWLPLTICLPLALLILLLFTDWCMVCTEMTAYNQRVFWGVMAIAGIGLAGAGWWWGRLLRRGKGIALPGVAVLLLWLLAAIIVSAALQQDMRPNVEEFILPRGRWLEYLMICYMPGVFYLLAVMAKLLPGRLVYPFAATTLLAPVACYLFFAVSFQLAGLFRVWPFFVFIAALIVLGAGFYLSMIKVLLHFIPWVFRTEGGRTAAVVVAAWVLPFGGLLLNIAIPFPVDFQDWLIYVVTLLNGVVLLLPVFRNRAADLPVVFLKGVFYPFSLYFFLVFLPWLPLSLPAIIVCGVGSLVLAPTLLFILQNYRLAEDYARLKGYLPKRQVMAAFALGLLVMPLYFIFDAFRDKAEIGHAVKVFFNSPYDLPMEKQRELSIRRIVRTQQRLYNAKHGVEMPFLSRVYNRIVFSDLVLSDDKINRIYYSLTGKKIKADERMAFSGESRGRRGLPLTGLAERRTAKDVSLQKLEAMPLEHGGARLCLIIGNDGVSNGEYVAKIALPPGVMVRALTLKIDGNVVPGRVFERKSAFWIYEKITTVKRDPALLSYAGPDLLRLLVFPVPPRGTREVSVDLVYPEGVAPEIDFDGRKTLLPMHAANTGWQLLSPAELQRLPVLQRRPELVFILDRSMEIRSYELLARLKELAGKTGATSCRVISGIFAAGELSDSYPLAELPKALQWYEQTYTPGPPGFAAMNVIKGAFLRYHALNSKDTYPLFVFLSSQEFDRSSRLADFAGLHPESEVMVVSGECLAWYYYDMRANTHTEIKGDTLNWPTRAVCRLPDGQVVRRDSGALCRKAETPADNDFAKAVALQADSRRLLFDPSLEFELLPQLIRRSKETGILIPQTAYIVLETEAQWKTLEKAEKNKLEKSSAYDLEEVRSDEPPLWLLLLFAVIFAVFSRRWIRHKASA